MASSTSLPPAEPGRLLLLNEQEVEQLLTMDMALEAVEQGLRRMGLDEAVNLPRGRAQTDHAMLHSMAGAIKSLGVMGAKLYSTSRKGPARFLFTLYDGKSGALLCLMQADYLGQVRTGAASGVATRLMAREDAAHVGIIGTGKQARTQIEAICKVRPIRHVSVFSRDEERRTRFAAEMSERCQTEMAPVSNPAQAVENQDIVITATTSREPVLSGTWLAQGTHINAIGSNFLGKAELDVATLRRCATIVIDSKDQGRIEAGDFQQALEENSLHWADVRELCQVVVGRYPGRKQPEDITLFKSLGIAVEDVAVAGRVYSRAVEEGVGRWIDW